MDVLRNVIDEHDARDRIFRLSDLCRALRKCNIPGPDEQPPERVRAECAAICSPMGALRREALEAHECADSRGRVTAEMVAYWAVRARESRHPVLCARYGHLAWALGRIITNTQHDVALAHIAIDGYFAATRMDDGSAWEETRDGIRCALELALSLGDRKRALRALREMACYVRRTADIRKPGTYVYLIECVLAQTPDVVTHARKGLARDWAVANTDQMPVDTIEAIADLFRQSGFEDDANTLSIAAAQKYELWARDAQPIGRVFTLLRALELYEKAGASDDKARVHQEIERTLPEAAAALDSVSHRQEVPREVIERVRVALRGDGQPGTMADRLIDTVMCVLDDPQGAVEQSAAAAAVSVLRIDEQRIIADPGDDRNDPDGRDVVALWGAFPNCEVYLDLFLTLPDLRVLDSCDVMALVKNCPLFREDHRPIVQRGVEAHFSGNYLEAIHLLVPQVEAAIVNMLEQVGETRTRVRRGGCSIMERNMLGHALGKERIKSRLGEQRRLLLVAVLNHPKGLNIRNDVCHGVWPASRFDAMRSCYLLLALLIVARSPFNTSLGENKASAQP